MFSMVSVVNMYRPFYPYECVFLSRASLCSLPIGCLTVPSHSQALAFSPFLLQFTAEASNGGVVLEFFKTVLLGAAHAYSPDVRFDSSAVL